MNHKRQSADLMRAFASRTGLHGDAAPRRYLWTDAFAVCNFLELGRIGLLPDGRDAAVRLVEQVHRVLGAYAPADDRRGALGGRDESAFASRPTARGLRIGKPGLERAPGEPADDHEEWDRDGQYFHYLTRWMHALERCAEVLDDARYHRWAVELADAAFRAFVVRDARGRPSRMVWKMSVDLDRPLVASMGQHDPLDGWVTARQLSASRFADAAERESLAAQASDYWSMCAERDWASPDPLGIGGLLVDAWRLARCAAPGDSAVVGRLLEAAAAGLSFVVTRGQIDGPARRRLAFRELGLAIGLHAAARLADAADGDGKIRLPMRRVEVHAPLAERIERDWLAPANRDGPHWSEHQDINEVMLATCLCPDGYLGDASPPQPRTQRSGGARS